MKKIAVGIVILFSLLSSGCIALAIGAVAGGYVLVKKVMTDAPNLTEEERLAFESRKIAAEDKEIFAAAMKVFQNKGFSIKDSNDTKGIIIAIREDPFLQVTLLIGGDVVEEQVEVRMVMKNEDGIVENKRIYVNMFKEINMELSKDAKQAQ